MKKNLFVFILFVLMSRILFCQNNFELSFETGIRTKYFVQSNGISKTNYNGISTLTGLNYNTKFFTLNKKQRFLKITSFLLFDKKINGNDHNYAVYYCGDLYFLKNNFKKLRFMSGLRFNKILLPTKSNAFFESRNSFLGLNNNLNYKLKKINIAINWYFDITKRYKEDNWILKRLYHSSFTFGINYPLNK